MIGAEESVTESTIPASTWERVTDALTEVALEFGDEPAFFQQLELLTEKFAETGDFETFQRRLQTLRLYTARNPGHLHHPLNKNCVRLVNALDPEALDELFDLVYVLLDQILDGILPDHEAAYLCLNSYAIFLSSRSRARGWIGLDSFQELEAS